MGTQCVHISLSARPSFLHSSTKGQKQEQDCTQPAKLAVDAFPFPLAAVNSRGDLRKSSRPIRFIRELCSFLSTVFS